MKSKFCYWFMAAALVISPMATVRAALPIKSLLSINGSNQVNLAWVANPGAVYVLKTTTNLAQPWQAVPGQPASFTTTSNVLSVTLAVDSVARFFYVVEPDTQGPQVYWTSPLNNSMGVNTQAVLQAWLQDSTGINTNSISLAYGTNASVTLADPRLTYSTNGVVTYTPGTNEVLGLAGQTVTVKLSAADTLGNVTTNFT